jgi:indole-3-glycerol phosphate synthase
MSNKLDPILQAKRAHIAARRKKHSLEELKHRAANLPETRKFKAALESCLQTKPYALIAEIKKASPSKGLIRPDFDPRALARAYRDGGAACLSVLTDKPYFEGQDHDLIAAREAVALPILRKDFMIDPYQIYESRCLGADCILLIMAVLSDDSAAELKGIAEELGMDALIEVHDKEELERALPLHPALLGINNRNLKTLQVDLQTSLDLAGLIPPTALGVAESGLATPQDLSLLKRNGIATFLIGESLLRHADVTAATKALTTVKN